MRKLIEIYRGFHIYEWSTGKIEVFRGDGTTAGISTINWDINAAKNLIDAKLED